MKKDIPYREQLLELSKLYKVPEIKSYIKSKKNLTTSQLELILLKNKIPLPAQSYSRKHVAEIKFKEQVITNLILTIALTFNFSMIGFISLYPADSDPSLPVKNLWVKNLMRYF